MNRPEPIIYLAEKSLQEVAKLVRRAKARRVFAVVDETAAQASGAETVLRHALASCDVKRFTGFDLNPQLRDIERGLEPYRQWQPDLVVALGGGTAIDLAKMINSVAAQPETARSIVTGKAPVTRPGKPLLAIPTTAGTGSEATQFAVAYAEKTKYSIAHEFLLPTYAIIDPTLTYSLPRGMTAATGLDAFCQAIESIWAVGATEESLGYATEAARLTLTHLVDAVHQPTPQSRRGMCRASHLAGKAINISKTTASHAISYAFTSGGYSVPSTLLQWPQSGMTSSRRAIVMLCAWICRGPFVYWGGSSHFLGTRCDRRFAVGNRERHGAGPIE